MVDRHGLPPDGRDLPPEFLELRRQYLVEAQVRGAEVERTAARLGGGDEAAVRDQLREAAHRLRGSGGLYGFEAISQAAAALEEALKAAADPAEVRRLAGGLAQAIRGTGSAR